jgi:hypothetical protein
MPVSVVATLSLTCSNKMPHLVKLGVGNYAIAIETSDDTVRSLENKYW